MNVKQTAACSKPPFQGSLSWMQLEHPEHSTCFQPVQALWALTFVQTGTTASDNRLLVPDRAAGNWQPGPARRLRSSRGPPGRLGMPPWEKPSSTVA